MDLSNDLISKFVKITNDTDKQKSKEGTVYGTAVKYDGGIYVKIDGSDLLTPVDTTADIEDGERVTITIKDHNATVTGNITSPSANEGTVTKKVTEAVDGIEDKVITEVETLVADRVSTKELDAEVARIDELIAGKATIEDLTATNATIENLKAKDAEIENLVADKATIGDLTATNATIGTLDAKVANIDTLVNGNLTSDNILSFNITSKNTTMEDAFIKDAMIDRITANKIMSGAIDTNNVVIQSTDGSMLLQGNILQMKDESGKVRIQIGKDTGGNFTFVLYDESGKGVLIDEEGIKSSDAIADGLIVDAKVADNANISGAKLDIASVITEVNKDNSTTIKSSKIYLNEQNQSLEVAFNSLKTQVETIQDVTIDGDLSSIVEQVQSNTTQIEANKEGINTLVAENVIRTEEISNLEGELQQVNTSLSNKYASLEQSLDGFKTTVSDTYTTKTEFNNLEVGGRNLLLKTDILYNNNEYAVATYIPSELLIKEQTYTLSICITPGTGVKFICPYVSRGNTHLGTIYFGDTAKQVRRLTFTFSGYNPNYTPANTSEANSYFTIYRFPNDGTVTTNSTIHWIKLEKGSKATDWTPAPEDVQASIYAVDGKFANYSTTTQMNSAIDQKAGEITSSVSQTYTTKTEFNNLEVGGRNLFIGSKDYAAGSWLNKSGWGSNGTTSDGLTILSRSTPWSGLYQSFTMKPNEVYTMSAYIKGDGKATVNCYGNGSLLKRSFSQGETASTTWRRYWFTYKNTSSSDVSWAGRFENAIDNATMQIYGIKCEKGDKATDWTPAPEDVQGQIDATNNNLTALTTRVSTAESKLTKDSLTTTIGNHYTTSSDVDGIITNKGYATTSQVEQTATALTATFTSSGGYNYLYNGNFKNGISHWTNNGMTRSEMWSPSGVGVYCNGAYNTTKYIHQKVTELDPTVSNYTVSCYIQASSKGSDGTTNPSRMLYCEFTMEDGTILYFNKNVYEYDKWIKMSVTANKGGTRFKSVRVYGYVRDTTKTVYFSDFMVEKGTVASEWSPNPNEVFAGVTTINNDGVKVSQSNYNGYTQMKADGFYVNNGTENVITCNSSGLVVKGNVTATSGKIASFTVSGNDLIGASVGMAGNSGTNQAFWAGSNTSGSAPFRVGHDGSLTATKANITGTINATSGTFAGTVETTTILKAYNAVYAGAELWGGFKLDSSGKYTSTQTFLIHGSTALQIDGNPTRISSVTGEVKIGDASSYDNLRAREIYAQEIIYTDDLRTRSAAQLSLSNVSMRSGNAFIDFSSGYGVIRVTDRNHLYLQTKGNTGGDTSAEIRCTRYSDASNYVNLRAHNVCAQNAVYANGVNVSSDINRKRDIELYSTDALHEVCTTPVYAYHLDTDKDEELKRIGIIMQEAPLDAIDLTGKGVDLYQMVTMLWRAVQQQQEMIKELKGE